MMTVIWVILGIMLVFGGPVMINAVIKLCRRDLGRFIEAAGCALNHHMRLSFALGRVFTFTPKLSGKSKYRAITEKNRSGARWLLVIIIILVVMFLSLQFFLACHQSNFTAFIRYLIHQIRL